MVRRLVSSVLTGILVIGLLVGPSATSLRASEFDRLTYLTFSGPVQIPGASLQSGTYIFELANPDSGTRLVRVLSADRRIVYATFWVVAGTRLTRAGDTKVTFREGRPGATAAIMTWFYPGETTGFEFVYPNQRSMARADAHPRAD